ncbi:MAG: NAD(+)/NADH kinase [Agathobacter sp.]|nr:NAD(+)/NADH kinase [Agathobacter sp.]
MQSFGIFANEYKDRNLEFSRKIATYIRSKGAKAQILKKGDSFDGVEVVLVLGGDGTMIRTATMLGKENIPLVGVNLGTLGYLCELEEDTVFPAIDCLMSDDYLLETRMMLTGAQVSSKDESWDSTDWMKDSDANSALNDIVLHRSNEMCVLSFHVYVNGMFLATYRADGIILSTPTGSTGYNMSAGGPIVDPKASIILLTPINAHNLNSKSIVLTADDVIEIEVGTSREEQDEKAIVSFDGDIAMVLKVNDRIRIAKADKETYICKVQNESFLEILRRKMN